MKKLVALAAAPLCATTRAARMAGQTDRASRETEAIACGNQAQALSLDQRVEPSMQSARHVLPDRSLDAHPDSRFRLGPQFLKRLLPGSPG